MKLSYNWLKELVDYSGSVEDLQDLLTRAGLSVEAVVSRGVDIDNVVVAQIQDSQPHPNADRLSICQVADGSAELRQIVCGAKNYRVGDKVPLALPGALLPGNTQIRIGKLRGVESRGMLCSGKELGLEEDSPGLRILPPEAPIGAPIKSCFSPDTILDLEITPNRGDWLSHLGVAREVAAFSHAALKWKPPELSAHPHENVSCVCLEDTPACSFYTLRRIRGVRVQPSPQWLCDQLEAVGLRPINNVVDVTNYVLFLLGQPLHAFDFSKIQGGIVVRQAREGESLIALDGKEYGLGTSDLVIADAQGPLAIAGVMGGAASGVEEGTTEILLESAVFAPSSIRQTGCRLGLSSEASYRFERGIDPAMVFIASELAATWIQKLGGGVLDLEVFIAGKAPCPSGSISLCHQRVRSLLGCEISSLQIRDCLEQLGLRCENFSQETSLWTIPSFRNDLLREVDLIEEVARRLGMEAIPETRVAAAAPVSQADREWDFRQAVSRRLVGMGFFEARTSTLVSHSLFQDLLPETEAMRLKNPLGEDQAFLRPGLIPGLLQALQRNVNHGERSVRLFEIGKVFRSCPPEESVSIALLMSGRQALTSWRGQGETPLDLFDLKGALQVLVGVRLQFVPSSLSFHVPVSPLSAPGALCLHVATHSGKFLGVAGQLSPAWQRGLDIPSPILVAEIHFSAVMESLPSRKSWEPIAKFPSVTRDLAVVVPREMRYEQIENVLFEAGEELLFAVEPFDVFTDSTGVQLPHDQRSIAMELTFRSQERTLTGEEVQAAENRLKQKLLVELGVEFRGPTQE